MRLSLSRLVSDKHEGKVIFSILGACETPPTSVTDGAALLHDSVFAAQPQHSPPLVCGCFNDGPLLPPWGGCDGSSHLRRQPLHFLSMWYGVAVALQSRSYCTGGVEYSMTRNFISPGNSVTTFPPTARNTDVEHAESDSCDLNSCWGCDDARASRGWRCFKGRLSIMGSSTHALAQAMDGSQCAVCAVDTRL